LNLACVAVTAVSLIGVEDETSFADTPRATNLTAFYREGQSFVTWREDDSVHDEWYRIYSSTKPITESNLADATYIARIPEGSREYRFLKDAPDRLKTLLDSYDWSRGIQLEDDDHAGKILPQGTGVFVRTIKQAARSYYAITIETDGKENVEIEPGKNSLLKPIRESVEPPGAIRLQRCTTTIGRRKVRTVSRSRSGCEFHGTTCTASGLLVEEGSAKFSRPHRSHANLRVGRIHGW